MRKNHPTKLFWKKKALLLIVVFLLGHLSAQEKDMQSLIQAAENPADTIRLTANPLFAK